MVPRPHQSTLFPYTTLFRSLDVDVDRDRVRVVHRLEPLALRRLRVRGRHGRVRSLVQGLAERSRSEEHTSELQSLRHLVCRLLLEKKKNDTVAAETANYIGR